MMHLSIKNSAGLDSLAHMVPSNTPRICFFLSRLSQTASRAGVTDSSRSSNSYLL